MEQTLLGLSKRLRLKRLERHHNRRSVQIAFTVINSAISLGLIGVAAHYADSLLLFPSLGPTAFLVFVKPTAPAAAPEYTIIGHLIGIGAGWLSLVCSGLEKAAPSLAAGDITWQRVGAVALSMALTTGLMVGFRKLHPPACATTLIIALGFVREPAQFLLLLAGVALLSLQALGINRLAGLPYPLWKPTRPTKLVL
jgi:CBS-domain-containing membrane protein